MHEITFFSLMIMLCLEFEGITQADYDKLLHIAMIRLEEQEHGNCNYELRARSI